MPASVPPPLPPSVEEAYRRKCIQMKQRLAEIDEANEASRIRVNRLKRQVEKMRLERAFLLEQLARRTSTNVEDSEGSPSPPPTVRDEYPTSCQKPHSAHTRPPQSPSPSASASIPASVANTKGPHGRPTPQPKDKPMRLKRQHRKGSAAEGVPGTGASVVNGPGTNSFCAPVGSVAGGGTFISHNPSTHGGDSRMSPISDIASLPARHNSKQWDSVMLSTQSAVQNGGAGGSAAGAGGKEPPERSQSPNTRRQQQQQLLNEFELFCADQRSSVEEKLRKERAATGLSNPNERDLEEELKRVWDDLAEEQRDEYAVRYEREQAHIRKAAVAKNEGPDDDGEDVLVKAEAGVRRDVRPATLISRGTSQDDDVEMANDETEPDHLRSGGRR